MMRNSLSAMHVETRAGEPESERPEPHDLVGAGAILFFSSGSEAGAGAL